MKIELNEGATNSVYALLGTITIGVTLFFVSSCAKEIGRQTMQEKAVRYQMGIVENNEHLAR